MGKVHGVNKQDRAKLLAGASGKSDVFLDLRGSKHLPPNERAIVNAQRPGGGTLPPEKVSDNVDALPPWWWNPANPAATKLPASVSMSKYARLTKALKAIDPKIGLTWHGARNVWQLWYHKPGWSSFGNGWVMVKEFEPFRNTDYILKVVAHMDSEQHGTASERRQKAADARVEQKKKVHQQLFQNDQDAAAASYEYMQIKNIGRGNKSVNYG